MIKDESLKHKEPGIKNLASSSFVPQLTVGITNGLQWGLFSSIVSFFTQPYVLPSFQPTGRPAVLLPGRKNVLVIGAEQVQLLESAL